MTTYHLRKRKKRSNSCERTTPNLESASSLSEPLNDNNYNFKVQTVANLFTWLSAAMERERKGFKVFDSADVATLTAQLCGVYRRTVFNLRKKKGTHFAFVRGRAENS